MLMSEIYTSLEEQLKEAVEKKTVLDKDIETKTIEYNKIVLEMHNLETELKEIGVRYEKAKGNVASIQGAIASLESGDFTPDTEEEKQAIAEEEKKVIAAEEEKNLVWKHKNAVIVKYDLAGEKLGTYRSQKMLAEELGISQPTVAYYMKKEEDTQLKKWGFYLRYEY